MYTAKIENSRGDILTLSQQEPRWQIVSISGLAPVSAQINTDKVAGVDGQRFNSAKLEMRNIVITLAIQGNIEINRQYLYTFFPTKDSCRFYFINDNRDVYIDGIVESFECDLFSNQEIAQISIICPQPEFLADEETGANMELVTPLFFFPFSKGADGANYPASEAIAGTDEAIEFSTTETVSDTVIVNDSESSTGMTITLDIKTDVGSIKILNLDNSEYILLSDPNFPSAANAFKAGDKIIIKTSTGEKSVYLKRNQYTTNYFRYLSADSTFLQLALGENHFSYSVDNGATDLSAVEISFDFQKRYRGV